MLWVKSFHIVFVVAWFAGLFYLPRIFVYHAGTEDSAGRERFKIMEHKLYNYIMTPAAVIALSLGLWMWLGFGVGAHSGWLMVKLALVASLVAYHVACGYYVREFAADRVTRTGVFFRWFNEFPTLILVAVAILTVVKPF